MNTLELIKLTKSKAHIAASLSENEKNELILSMAQSLINSKNEILKANSVDLENVKGSISDVMTDRLLLNEQRIEAMANGMKDIANLHCTVGEDITETVRPNGLVIKKRRVPLGLISIIYESRPNVTSDAACLSIKSGNACLLRCGKEAYNSCKAIVDALKQGIKNVGADDNILNLVSEPGRESANILMTATGLVDLLIPRGGKGLIDACVKNATVPCIQTGTGICHIYVDSEADLDMALNIINNAKTSRPSVCNAQEVLLVHENIAEAFLPRLKELLVDIRNADGKIPVELRLCEKSASLITGTPAGENDFDTEFLDYILAVKIVSGVDEAISHILTHSTGHSEAIITNNKANADTFVSKTDSAAVYVNASTRFTDGGEFGLGCEMGISTQKLHARGPMGLEELTTYKYIIEGGGQIR
ncbi:MAG: glutamate-5-semialdehyde dehydrogenase [Ruminococcaceae bacterium]|nr:glutamate-5-semialdehyde dehydrogenase [Oscillospiraceae bacterium]